MREGLAGAVLSVSNGLLLTVALMATISLLHYLATEVKGWRDLGRRIRRIFDPGFPGGVFDLAVSISLILLGMAIRHQTAWEFRAFDTDLRLWQLAIGTVISAIGIVMLIWLTAPRHRARLYFWLCIGVSSVFMVASYALVAGLTPIWDLPI